VVTYRFGPFRLLPDQRRLERDGAAVALTPKAFDVLVALVPHRSRALSKDELLELVWSGASIEEGNLAQQVLLLRRALAAGGDCVATVPRHGYHFVAPVIEEHDANRPPIDSHHCLIWNDRELPLREGVTLIGRGEDADLRIPLSSVSRHHARIIVRGLEATLEDLGSRHGSWRGATRLAGATALAQGDQIRLRNAVIEYRLVMPRDTTIE
jgi:DNA-binding winged helix-turn-helix (wHTH) protein